MYSVGVAALVSVPMVFIRLVYAQIHFLPTPCSIAYYKRLTSANCIFQTPFASGLQLGLANGKHKILQGGEKNLHYFSLSVCLLALFLAGLHPTIAGLLFSLWPNSHHFCPLKIT